MASRGIISETGQALPTLTPLLTDPPELTGGRLMPNHIPCNAESCELPATHFGWCQQHYFEWLLTRGGQLELTPPKQRAARGTKPKGPPRPRFTVEQRFWNQIDKSSTCWLWVGPRTKAGYGQLYVGKTDGTTNQVYAHRYSYELHHGPIPDGLLVRHTCDIPACVNPAHLLTGTTADNMHDRDVRARHGQAKLSFDDVRDIRAAHEGGESQHSIARCYGLCQSSVSLIVRGMRWKHVA